VPDRNLPLGKAGLEVVETPRRARTASAVVFLRTASEVLSLVPQVVSIGHPEYFFSK
jgi:hypothetical protein